MIAHKSENSLYIKQWIKLILFKVLKRTWNSEKLLEKARSKVKEEKKINK